MRSARVDSWTAELRAASLITDRFVAGTIALRHVDLDRVVIGSAVPTSEPLTLAASPSLLATYFTERRELGVLNIGGSGSIVVDGQRFAVGSRDALYVRTRIEGRAVHKRR